MKSPCEEIVWNVLPSIRAAIAEELIKRGISQKDVSKMLEIAPCGIPVCLEEEEEGLQYRVQRGYQGGDRRACGRSYRWKGR